MIVTTITDNRQSFYRVIGLSSTTESSTQHNFTRFVSKGIVAINLSTNRLSHMLTTSKEGVSVDQHLYFYIANKETRFTDMEFIVNMVKVTKFVEIHSYIYYAYISGFLQT